MAVQLKSTAQYAIDHGVKILIHGPSDAGKTFQASTTGEATLVLSAESGLLTLHRFDIPYFEVKTIEDINYAYDQIVTGEWKDFKWIILDSVSEIAEVVLSAEKAATKDVRKAYGELQDIMMKLLRAFRDLKDKNVVFLCKQDSQRDEQTGITRYGPLLPGQNLQKNIPYMFDFVLALRKDKDENDQLVRYYQCESDFSYMAKNRGGALDFFEPANLAHIANKLRNSVSKPQPLKEVK